MSSSIDENNQHHQKHNNNNNNNNNEWTNSLPKTTTTSSSSSTEQQLERDHLETVCDSFRQYATFMKCARAGRSARVAALPPSHRDVLPRWMLEGTAESSQRDEVMRDAELRNQFFFDCMLRHAGLPNSQDVLRDLRGQDNNNNDGGGVVLESRMKDMDVSNTNNNSNNDPSVNVNWSTDERMSKVQSVLKSLSRDWSKEGLAERAMSYQPILNGLRKYLPSIPPSSHHPRPRICVPGAGLGRLALEIYAMGGYDVQGNEFSLHMLLASDFILNGCSSQKPFAISPWLASTQNVCRAADPARFVHVPDVDPASVMPVGEEEEEEVDDEGEGGGEGGEDVREGGIPDFSMAAGEFVSIYSKPEERGQWQGVASCFFLDTAPNVVDYLKVIWDMLDDGGILLNFGPLLFHWSGPNVRPDDVSFQSYLAKHSHMDARYLESIDMSWEDVREVLWRVGFEILDQNVGIKARYTADLRSFMNSDYRCIFFVARKVVSSSQQQQRQRQGMTKATDMLSMSSPSSNNVSD